MQKLCLALLAVATALAISPAALADSLGVTATSGVTFNASGVTAGSGVVEGGLNTTGVFLPLVGAAVNFDAWSSSLSSATLAYSIGSGASATTFTIDSLNFYNFSTGGGGSGLFAGGSGTIDDAGTLYGVHWTASGNSTDNVTYSFGLNSTVTPEPSSLLLLGTGLLGLAFVAFRKAKSTGVVSSMQAM